MNEFTPITPQELEQLERCTNAAEWQTVVKAIKKARGGRGESFPPDWYEVVIASGMIDRVHSKWDRAS